LYSNTSLFSSNSNSIGRCCVDLNTSIRKAHEQKMPSKRRSAPEAAASVAAGTLDSVGAEASAAATAAAADSDSEDLNDALSALSEAQVIKPDAAELEAIKTFCNIEVKLKANVLTASERVLALRAESKMFKQKLEAIIKGRKCLALSKADAARFDLLATQAAVETMPPFLRLVPANKDATITTEVIQEALESITQQDFTEAEDIKGVVLKNIRRTIRSFTESMKIMPSLQRGMTSYDVPELSSEEADTMWQFWLRQQRIKESLASKKADPEAAAKKEECKKRVESFFIRTGLISQRIVVEGHPYKLVRRVSVRKPKIGIGRLEKMLDEVLQDLQITPTTFRSEPLIKALQIQVSSVAPETKTNVSLSAIKETD
jgi:hypothetical protein